jgi:hypothetical protein
MAKDKRKGAKRDRAVAPLPPPPPRFDDWFRCLFQRPEDLWWTKPISFDDAYMSLEAEYEFSGTNAEILELATYTLAHAGTVLATCSDDQVAEGLFLLFNSVNSNIPHQIIDELKDDAQRHAFIASVLPLYRGIFAVRCKPSLGALSEPAGRLNMICYMLWDGSPLNSLASFKDRTTGRYPLVEALTAILRIPHDACIESALHGLGHAVFDFRSSAVAQLIPAAIDAFLSQTTGLRPELRAYAEHAKTGRVL